ncbi:hypothetical protein KIN20_033103 [Parelaphostrongylus tenuis]|uniref:Uncharacterized protein n=1 Tax=Parelaphostrongylus tenuis TaxID=148309 RepID=A0AAD5R7I6_PARTN|nr:hypothetical protein KIN20_033103 [Parelaphostrongylus tenuis]
MASEIVHAVHRARLSTRRPHCDGNRTQGLLQIIHYLVNNSSGNGTAGQLSNISRKRSLYTNFIVNVLRLYYLTGTSNSYNCRLAEFISWAGLKMNLESALTLITPVDSGLERSFVSFCRVQHLW